MSNGSVASAVARFRPLPDLPARHEPIGCRSQEVLARVGDKRSVYVIYRRGRGTLRFGEHGQRVEGSLTECRR